jgi:U3 small nucleolar RNA-associated protein MPP10
MKIAQEKVDYANADMLTRIQKLEDQMASNKKDTAKGWQLQGEVTSNERPVNSLLAEHLDFNIVSKLPPTITQERSTKIEGVIKQRILDELFDDPIRKYIGGKTKGDVDDDDGVNFGKSKKGLGELYEDDYRKKLLKNDPSSFLLAGNDLTGADASLKKEVAGLMKTLFYQLDQLSNLHFTPKPAGLNEATIST